MQHSTEERGKSKRLRGSRTVQSGICGILVGTSSRDAGGGSCGLVKERRKFLPRVQREVVWRKKC